MKMRFFSLLLSLLMVVGLLSGTPITAMASGDNETPFIPWIPGIDKPEEPEKPSFEDVSEKDYFFDAVAWAVEQGITSGTDECHFSPGLLCNRATVVTFLYSAAGKPAVTGSNPFKDVPTGSWYEKAVLWAKANGITSGVSDTEFGAATVCNRAQVVTFLYAANGK